jgi:HEAT repeat protein
MKESVPDLLDILEKPDRLGSEQHFKPLAIQALGKIGDPGVLKTLKNLFTARSLLYKSAQRQLKLEIIRSLENYPSEHAKSILEVAMLSGDGQIRTAAQKVYSRIGDV